MMLALALSLSMSSAPAHLAAPSASLLGQLPVRQGLLVESLGLDGRSVGGGIGNIVGGAVLTVLGVAGVVGGLVTVAAGQLAADSARQTLTIVGWSVFGVGALMTLIGIPLIIVGIVRVVKGAVSPARAGLTVTDRGSLAVAF